MHNTAATPSPPTVPAPPFSQTQSAHPYFSPRFFIRGCCWFKRFRGWRCCAWWRPRKRGGILCTGPKGSWPHKCRCHYTADHQSYYSKAADNQKYSIFRSECPTAAMGLCHHGVHGHCTRNGVQHSRTGRVRRGWVGCSCKSKTSRLNLSSNG